MYALRIFGLRLSVAADDLAIPAAMTLCLRVLWLCASATFFVLSFEEDLVDCKGDQGRLLQLYMLLVLVLTVLSACAFLAMNLIANTGTLHEPEKRKAMPAVITVLLGLYLLEAVLNGFGTYLATQWSEKELDASCSQVAHRFLVFLACAVALVWVDCVIFAACWWVFLNRNKTNVTGLRLDEFELKSLEWQTRCRRWCNILGVASCGCYGYHVKHGNETEFAYSQVGDVFATFFTGLKLTPTELLAALFLLKAVQLEERRAAESQHQLTIHVDPADGEAGQLPLEKRTKRNGRVKPKLERFPSSVGVQEESQLMDTLHELHNILKYSESINSWKLHLLKSLLEKRPVSGAAELVTNACFNAKHRRRRPEMHQGDNCCAWNHTAFVSMSSIRAEDLVFSHFASYATELVAYAVAVDHQNKNVIVGFRGSLALADFLTDATIQPEHLHAAGDQWGFDGIGHYAHSGMLQAALKARQVFEETGILHKLFRKERDASVRSPQQQKMAEDDESTFQYVDDDELPDCRGYQLIVVGESLGAGVAAIESLLLRGAFPTLKGYGISTPGCIFSLQLADQVAEFFTTLFVGKDLVPRANWESLRSLRTDVVDMLRRCKVNKNVALKSVFKRTPVADMLYAPEEVPDTDGVRRVDAMAAKMTQVEAETGSATVHHVPTFCPGKIIHLAKVQTEATRRCCGLGPLKRQRSYQAFLVHDRRDLCRFVISSSAVRDHMPHVVRYALEDVLE